MDSASSRRLLSSVCKASVVDQCNKLVPVTVAQECWCLRTAKGNSLSTSESLLLLGYRSANQRN